MIFAAPWVLLGLAALPVLWWLLRVTPPAPRNENFPAIRLLFGLRPPEETPARTPLWLLCLRMLAAALIILGLAQPVLDAGASLPGNGPVLLVIDDGWAAAADWPARIEAVSSALDRAERAGRPAALLATARDQDDAAPATAATMPVSELRARLAALRPKPWPPDRQGAADALAKWHATGTAVVYVADGITDGAGYQQFADSLRRVGPVTEFCCDQRLPAARILLPPRSDLDRLTARIAQPPQLAPTQASVLAQSGDGRTFNRVDVTIARGAASAEAAISLPPELRNQLGRLVLEGPPSAGSVLLLDEADRRRPVGLLAPDPAAEAPLTGSLYYIRRALAPFAELREADLPHLLGRELSVIIMPDRPLTNSEEASALDRWVKKGGLLVRFAGPRIAERPIDERDPLMPVRLMGGDRQLGGAMSWSEPAGLAPFPAGSPFAGLPVPGEVRISRQVLAEPSAQLSSQSWALLADGTPLVTQETRGNGRIVLFHVTSNADWSNLPLSGLFVQMLRRLVLLSAGVATSDDDRVLSPAETLDGYGVLGTPSVAATGLKASEIGKISASPRHPPGFYGPENGRRALNLGDAVPLPEAAPPVPGAEVELIGAQAPERLVGPWLLAAAIVLLAIDLLASLRLRGLLRRSLTAAALGACWVLSSLAPAHALEHDVAPAHATRLAYITTGDDELDGVSRSGLEGLSNYVNRRTSATLVEPDAVVPGETDLSFYPLLYWPIKADAQPLAPGAVAALNDYMNRGGIIVIDTRDGGSGEGMSPGGSAALPHATEGLLIPALAPLTTDHVLARAFYLLQDFPGRFDGARVWVQRDQDRSNDSVSPVIIGAHDWAAAWATDRAGRNPYAVIPGGTRQRTLAYRFGVNLVMYALTGNYKGDQVHVPAILERLGQ